MKHYKLQRDRRRGIYFVRVMQDGVSKYFPLGTNKTQAQDQMDNIIIQIARGELPVVVTNTTQIKTADGRKDMMLDELAHLHLEWVERNRARGTYVNRKFHIANFRAFINNERAMVSHITRRKLEEFSDWARKNHGRGENGGTEAMAHVKTLLRWAEDQELCDLNFKKFPPIRRAPATTRRIPVEDLAKILNNADEEFRDMLLFQLSTGLRPNELRNLVRSNLVRNSEGKLFVEIQRHKTSKQVANPPPRSIPLPPEGEEIVNRLIKAHPFAKTLFVNADGNIYCRYTFRNRLRRLCQRVKVPQYSPYELRHTFASIAADRDSESTALANLMGHSTTRTLKRYVHNTTEAHYRTISAVSNHLKSLLEPKEEKGPSQPPLAFKKTVA